MTTILIFTWRLPKVLSTLSGILFFLVIPSTAQLNVWQPTGPFQGSQWGYLTVAVHPTNGNIVYTGTYHTSSGYQGILFKTTSGGPPWTNASFGLASLPIREIEIDPAEPNIVYAVTYYDRTHIYKSTDSGATWQLKDPPNLGWVSAFEIARSDPNVIFAVGDQLYVSRDRGESWSSRKFPTPWNALQIAVSPFDPDLVVVSLCEYYNKEECNSLLYKSSNAGMTWSEPVLDPPFLESIDTVKYDPLRPNVVYASSSGYLSEAGIYRSQDSGNTWTFYSTSGAVYDLEFDPRIPTTMYAVGLFNLAKSTDGGINWAPFTSGIPQYGPGFLDVDFSGDGRFIHAATSTGVFRAQVRDDVSAFRRVTGRVTDGAGRAMPRAFVSMANAQGLVRQVTANPFGYYVFNDVHATYMYRMYVTTKGYQFSDSIVQVDSDLEVNFVAEPAAPLGPMEN